MIAIIDYGMGNLGSVYKGLLRVSDRVKVTADPVEASGATAIVLPGVGAFEDAKANLDAAGMSQVVIDAISEGKPFLGICLGLHLLFDYSEENGIHEGLGLVKGKVVRLPSIVKVPHIGWNQLAFKKDLRFFDGIKDGSFFYFVHSYHVVPDDPAVVATTTDYGLDFVSAISWGSLLAVQFHPEKSGKLGLKVLENFVRVVQDRREGVD